MTSSQILILVIGGGLFLVIALIIAIGDGGSLKSFKNKPVGNGQHGTARFATKGEVSKTYKQIPYTPHFWRKGEQLPTVDGLIVGCRENTGQMTALVDDSDIHTLMIGASGVGKTANFLYPNIEYCCAAGMSFATTDTKATSIETPPPLRKSIMATRFRLLISETPLAAADIICCTSSISILTYTKVRANWSIRRKRKSLQK